MAGGLMPFDRALLSVAEGLRTNSFCVAFFHFFPLVVSPVEPHTYFLQVHQEFKHESNINDSHR